MMLLVEFYLMPSLWSNEVPEYWGNGEEGLGRSPWVLNINYKIACRIYIIPAPSGMRSLIAAFIYYQKQITI